MLERCCTTLDQVREAAENGAGRVELCRDLYTGGLTPCEKDIRQAVSVGIPVNVLVRPRGGDFVFNASEVEQMKKEIILCRNLGVNGVVIGALSKDGNIDLETMKVLMAEAKPLSDRKMEVTFHRAFDECANPFRALEEIISLGCDRILTSGQRQSALEGKELIAKLVEAAKGRIIIMPGAGITPKNLPLLKEYTNAIEYHGTRLCAKE